jgi:hypothetical protein
MNTAPFLALALAAHLGSCQAECVGCQPALDADRPVAVAHRFEVKLWEMPLARAEELYRPAAPDSASVALLIDERGLAKVVRELAARDPDVRPIPRLAFEAPAGARGFLPPRAVPPGEATWGDGLRLELGAAQGQDWAAHQLDFACVWTSPQGERLAAAAGSTPLPPDHDVLVWCLPSKDLAAVPEPRSGRAVLAIVRLDPRFE